MNETLVGALLGLVQGLTEFLPVSSSGHLSLIRFLMCAIQPESADCVCLESPEAQGCEQGEDVAMTLVLHLGTLIPVLFVYRESILGILRDAMGGSEPMTHRSGVRLLFWMFIGSLPTAAIGLAFEDEFEAMMVQPWIVGTAFLVTGGVLLATRWISQGSTRERDLKWWQAVLIGVVQGLAITPGISRSGSTIAVGLLLGLDREFAARYSFLLSIPAIAGANLLKLPELELQSWSEAVPLLTGFLCAMVTGYLALTVLLKLVNKGAFWKFSPYLCVVACVSFWCAAG